MLKNVDAGPTGQAAEAVDFLLWREGQHLRVRLPFMTVAYLLSWMLCWYADRPPQASAVGGMLVAAFFALSLCVQMAFARPPAQMAGPLLRWVRWQGGLALAGALAWGVAHAWLQTSAGGNREPAAGLLTNLLLASIAVFVLPMRFRLTLASLALMMLPTLPVMLGHGDAREAEAVMLVACWVGLMAAARWAWRDYRARLRMEAELVEQREHYQRLNRQDELTGLANRAHFEPLFAASLAQASRAGSSLSLAVFDVDGLARINQGSGHAAGDECLRMVAQGLGGIFRRNSDIVARVGGDDLVALLPHTDPAEALGLAEEFSAGIKAGGARWQGGLLPLSVSGAVGTFDPELDVNAAAFMARVRAALETGRLRGAGGVTMAQAHARPQRRAA